MSDFFSGIYTGIKQPDVVMNDGPLPPLSISGGYPEGFNANPDGQINYATSLLGDLDPYAYGEAARLSSQAAYQNIPHVCQRIIPSLDLPESQPCNMGGGFFRLSHQVDDGDVAFVIRAMFSPFELVNDKKKFNRQGILYAIDPVVNLATVNYMLHGLQRYGFDKNVHKTWNTIWIALGIDQHFSGDRNYDKVSFSQEMTSVQNELDMLTKDEKTKRSPQEALRRLYLILKMRAMRRKLVDYLIKHVIKPFGIPRGSEKQGGQHQGSNSPVTWPVDFVTAMVVDGKVINLVNFWKHDDINAGDDLMMYVEDRPCVEYVLSHNPKSLKKQVFPSLSTWEMPASLAEYSKEGHISTEGEDVLKRIWDLFSEIAAKVDKDDPVLDGLRDRHPPQHDFDRSGIKAADLKRRWEDEAAIMAAASSGAYTKYNQPGDHPRHYIIDGKNKIDLDTDEAYYEMYAMLFLFADAGLITDFVAQVQSFSAEYQLQIADAVRQLLRETHLDDALPEVGEFRRRRRAQFEKARHLTGVQGGRPILVQESIFQLVPGVSSSYCSGVKQAIWRHGYWHIARSQIMHFKYDQHVEMHNGIHAAIRGKLLEATFAPVWVEPLESAVLGYGHGGDGCTTAQTFALSGAYGGRKSAKRPRITLGPPGSVVMTLTTLYRDGCRLHDRVDAFLRDCRSLEPDAGRCMTAIKVDLATRNEFLSLFPAYRYIRLEFDRQSKAYEEIRTQVNTDEERRVNEQFTAVTRAIEGKMYCTDRSEFPQAVDDFVKMYIMYTALLLPDVRYEERQFAIFGDLCDSCVRYSSNVTTGHQYVLAPDMLGTDGLGRVTPSLEWRTKVSFAEAVLYAVMAGQNLIRGDEAIIPTLSFADQQFVFRDNMLRHLLETAARDMSDPTFWTAENVWKAAVCAVQVFSLSGKLQSLQHRTNRRNLMPGSGFIDHEEQLKGLITQVVEGLRNSGGKSISLALDLFHVIPDPAVGRLVVDQFFRSVGNMEWSACVDARRLGAHHVLGAYVGSMFSSIVNFLGYHGNHSDVRDFRFVDPLVGNRWSGTHTKRGSRLCMIRCAQLLASAGVVIADNMLDAANVGSPNLLGTMCLAMYLFFLHLMGHMQSIVAEATNPIDSEDGANRISEALKGMDIKMQEKCSLAARAAKGFARSYTSFVDATSRYNFLVQEYSSIAEPGVRNYMRRKLRAVVQHVADADGAADRGARDAVGFRFGARIFECIYEAHTRTGLTQRIVHQSLFLCLQYADRQIEYDRTTGAVAARLSREGLQTGEAVVGGIAPGTGEMGMGLAGEELQDAADESSPVAFSLSTCTSQSIEEAVSRLFASQLGTVIGEAQDASSGQPAAVQKQQEELGSGSSQLLGNILLDRSEQRIGEIIAASAESSSPPSSIQEGEAKDAERTQSHAKRDVQGDGETATLQDASFATGDEMGSASPQQNQQQRDDDEAAGAPSSSSAPAKSNKTSKFKRVSAKLL